MEQSDSQKQAKNGMFARVGRWCVEHPMLAVGIYIALVSAFFLRFPDVDFRVSGLFYFPQSGFAAQHEPFLQDVRHLGPFFVRVIAISCVLVLVLKLLLPERAPLLPLRQPLFLLSTLITGPGIVVNAILKDNWGRPRPRNVEEFGGDLPFQPVWKMTDYCDSNCSFVSGEASAGMWLVALVFVVPVTWRKGVLAFLIPFCIILSANRVAFGGHFFSDTLISWGVTLLVILVAYRLLYQTEPPLVTDSGLDAGFTRAGRWLQFVFRRAAKRTGDRVRGAVRVFSKT